jgi:hypothetical protein
MPSHAQTWRTVEPRTGVARWREVSSPMTQSLPQNMVRMGLTCAAHRGQRWVCSGSEYPKAEANQTILPPPPRRHKLAVSAPSEHRARAAKSFGLPSMVGKIVSGIKAESVFRTVAIAYRLSGVT